ncbi:hypothetical protein EFR58_05630, partial [Lactobacillus delbrueckii subsp. bulgaricus]|nr:hypothetical protein [Lactobacillus delbrueckii subsp. bulgaricus]
MLFLFFIFYLQLIFQIKKELPESGSSFALVKVALCQILLMLVKKSYICLMKALNRTRLFSA